MCFVGCVINDYVDRKVDGSVKCIENRLLVNGEVQVNEVLSLFLLYILVVFFLVFMLNW